MVAKVLAMLLVFSTIGAESLHNQAWQQAFLAEEIGTQQDIHYNGFRSHLYWNIMQAASVKSGCTLPERANYACEAWKWRSYWR